jgi:hypothetical protein
VLFTKYYWGQGKFSHLPGKKVGVKVLQIHKIMLKTSLYFPAHKTKSMFMLFKIFSSKSVYLPLIQILVRATYPNCSFFVVPSFFPG